jgi:hypothetical protein
MEKKELLELAKKRGLDVAEEAVESLGELALDIVGHVIKASKNQYDDMIWMAVEGKAREELKKLIDKIDGEED